MGCDCWCRAPGQDSCSSALLQSRSTEALGRLSCWAAPIANLAYWNLCLLRRLDPEQLRLTQAVQPWISVRCFDSLGSRSAEHRRSMQSQARQSPRKELLAYMRCG